MPWDHPRPVHGKSSPCSRSRGLRAGRPPARGRGRPAPRPPRCSRLPSCLPLSWPDQRGLCPRSPPSGGEGRGEGESRGPGEVFSGDGSWHFPGPGRRLKRLLRLMGSLLGPSETCSESRGLCQHPVHASRALSSGWCCVASSPARRRWWAKPPPSGRTRRPWEQPPRNPAASRWLTPCLGKYAGRPAPSACVCGKGPVRTVRRSVRNALKETPTFPLVTPWSGPQGKALASPGEMERRPRGREAVTRQPGVRAALAGLLSLEMAQGRPGVNLHQVSP